MDTAPATLTDLQEQRASRLLEQLVRTSPGAEDMRVPDAPRSVASRRRTAVRRLVLLPLTAAAVGAGVIVLPFVDPGQAAYASWTSEPGAISAADLAIVDPLCRLVRDGRTPEGDSIPYTLAATERRGDLVGLLYRSDDPDMSATCLATLPPGSPWVRDLDAAAGGSSGPALPAPPDGFTDGAISQFEQISVTDGAVGDDVVGVTIHAGDLRVEATIAEGRYYAWWPGPAFTQPAEPAPSGEGGPEPLLTYDLHLSDGTVVRDAQPARPS
jgi:hypothetical protein